MHAATAAGDRHNRRVAGGAPDDLEDRRFTATRPTDLSRTDVFAMTCCVRSPSTRARQQGALLRHPALLLPENRGPHVFHHCDTALVNNAVSMATANRIGRDTTVLPAAKGTQFPLELG